MKVLATIGSAALALVAAAPTSAADGDPVIVREEMQQHVNPAMSAIWDLTNAALDDNLETDPTLIGDAGWATIAEQAGMLEAAGRRMAEAGTITAAAPENAVTEDYDLSMSDVQALLTANPAAFRAYGASFAGFAARLRTAAEARDGALVGQLAGEADGVCESCHLTFWAAPEV